MWPRWSISHVKSLPRPSSRLMRRSWSCERSTVPSSWRRTIHAVTRPAAINTAYASVRDWACTCASASASEMTPRFSAISSAAITSVLSTPSTIAVAMLTRMPATATSSTAPPSTMACVPSPEYHACNISVDIVTLSDSVADAGFQPRRESPQASRPPTTRQQPISARDWPSRPRGAMLRMTSTIRSNKAPAANISRLSARTATTAYGSSRRRPASSDSS